MSVDEITVEADIARLHVTNLNALFKAALKEAHQQIKRAGGRATTEEVRSIALSCTVQHYSTMLESGRASPKVQVEAHHVMARWTGEIDRGEEPFCP